MTLCRDTQQISFPWRRRIELYTAVSLKLVGIVFISADRVGYIYAAA